MDSVVEAHRQYFGGTAEVVFDVGTRDGDDAEFLREKLHASKVYAIDANPAAIALTQKAYPNFEIIETAVSDFTGTVQFFQNNSPDRGEMGTSSIDISKGTRADIESGLSQRIEVPVIRMDELLENLGLGSTPIDVMKVDTESYSYEVLAGMGEKVRNVKVFHLETERKYNRPGHRNNKQIAALMRHFEFFLVDVSYEWGYNIQDQVWVNTKLAKRPPRGQQVSEV